MKLSNLKTNLVKDGFYDVEEIDGAVKVNIGFMAHKDWSGYISERARFDDLKLRVMNWAAIHGTSCKRDGGAMIVYGE